MGYFGLTRDDYRRMLARQHGVCAICCRVNENGRRLGPDHSHATGQLRDLLCGRCNSALAGFRDALASPPRALGYLAHPPAEPFQWRWCSGWRGYHPLESARLFKLQGQRCGVCRSRDPRHRFGWHVDHDHDTGLIRGILCHGCNTAIGSLHESPALLRAVASYLRRHEVAAATGWARYIPDTALIARHHGAGWRAARAALVRRYNRRRLLKAA